ncbi:MAG: immunoglobulin [Ethanoligenens sp.]
MKLSRYEQETIICYNEEEATASVYTHNNRLAAKLKRLAEKYPEKVRPERRERRGAVSYTVPKSCISVREPYSDERRNAASIKAKEANNRPPDRSIRSKTE